MSPDNAENLDNCQAHSTGRADMAICAVRSDMGRDEIGWKDIPKNELVGSPKWQPKEHWSSFHILYRTGSLRRCLNWCILRVDKETLWLNGFVDIKYRPHKHTRRLLSRES